MPTISDALHKLPCLGQENQPGYVYLNCSDSLTWSEAILRSIAHQLTDLDIRQYPAQASRDLENKIKDLFCINDALSIFFGNGCIDLLNLCFQSQCIPSKTIFTVKPSFFLYDHLCRTYHCKHINVPLLPNLSLPVEPLLKQCQAEKNPLIILAFPNNPTGHCFSINDLETLLQKSGATIIVDETYYLYSGQSCIELLDKYNNLILVRSFSKIGMAGLRLGYLLASPIIATQLKAVYLPFQTNSISLKIAKGLLDHSTYLFHQIDQIISQRDEIITHFQTIPGVKCYPSKTSFINFSFEQFSSQALYSWLYDRKVVTHPVHIPPLLNNTVRSYIGEPWQNNLLIEAVRELPLIG